MIKIISEPKDFDIDIFIKQKEEATKCSPLVSLINSLQNMEIEFEVDFSEEENGFQDIIDEFIYDPIKEEFKNDPSEGEDE